MARAEANPIICEPLRRISEPANETELAQCARLKKALEKIEFREARLAYPHEDFFACLTFEGPRPEAWWQRWMWVQVGPAIGHSFAWLGYISGINPHENILFFVPRPGRLDQDLASTAKRSTPGHRINYVKMGVLYPQPSSLIVLSRLH